MRLPLLLDVRDRLVLVVGGGPVAARRAAGLVEAGARVRVVAPEVVDELAALAARGAVTHEARRYAPGDLDGAWLAYTATGHPETDARVASDAEDARVWCSKGGDPAASRAWTPSVARAGDVTVAVGAGGDPRRAAAIKDAVALLLDTGALPVRRRRPGPGAVALVGGGPGARDLITTRGRRLLAEADVVVVDRLAPRELLDELDPDVEVIEAGKTAHRHTLTQDQINAVLVERALAGRRVVRLKGGDPFVLGRGSEEVLACVAAGVPVEVVPGVTSAIAVPGAAGIPVTHRGLSRQVTIVSAHEAQPDWGSLAALEGTLVLLMGVGQLRDQAARLVEHGKDASTPVAIVERGTTPEQRTTRGTLAGIADAADAAGVRSPAVIVIGEVAGLVLDAAPAAAPGTTGAGRGTGGGAGPDVPGAVEPSKVEPSGAEPSRSDQSQGEPSQGEPAGADPGTPAD
ncbi:uroporphyrinogen-III C-methyltransferase [Cellulomonas sp. 179-A 4D5 NHS]|uniref:uroporphyrinogen-III C-methyltransferase n=1 Tax=Cellulomonas sp. 179-A 4D5 NHS TaxID=3142378 RepID=UPI00399EFD93